MFPPTPHVSVSGCRERHERQRQSGSGASAFGHEQSVLTFGCVGGRVPQSPGPPTASLREAIMSRIYTRRTVVERFWSHVSRGDDCWMWQGHIDRVTGYGHFCIGYRPTRAPVPAHRVAYELAIGPIPEGLQIDHVCRVRACVRPDHLEAVTAAENIQRAKSLLTSCPRGHLYDYVCPNGARGCLTCRHETSRRFELTRIRKPKGAPTNG